MKNFKIILISFIVGAVVYHFTRPFIIKKMEKKIDKSLNEELNDPETIKEINEN